MQLSVIMPTYNGMKYLKQSVDSVISQDLTDWEFLISDDASTDGTREFLSGLRDPRIRVYFQPRNIGIFGNLNFLVSVAKGGLTQIICQDDYFVDRQALCRVLKVWSSLESNIAFLRCNYGEEIYSSIQRLQSSAIPSIVKPELSEVLFFVFGCVAGNLSNMSMRTSIVKDEGWFRSDLPYAGDYEFWSRVGRSRPWAVSPTLISSIRYHDERGSVQLNKHGEVLPQMRSILESLFGSLVGRGLPPKLLQLMATVHHISYIRHGGVLRALKGEGFNYLRGVHRELDLSPFALGPVAGWLIYFASLGGRMFSVPLAKYCLYRAGYRQLYASR